MGVHRLLARRPREESEAAVLRRHERYRVALIVGELCGGEMSRPAKLGRVENRGDSTFDRFGQGDVFHLGPPLPPCDLGSEASSSYSVVRTVAPSTAVRPATASTARSSASCQERWSSSAGVSRLRSVSSPKDGESA